MRTLKVYINLNFIGTLSELNNIWQFKYTESWLNTQDNYPLSPDIPLSQQIQIDGATNRPIQWFFDNLLPEEGARELLAQDTKVTISDAFGLLEAAGAESAGAITLTNLDLNSLQAELRPLTEQKINQRISLLPDIPLNGRDAKRMSLAGAQHKMLVTLDNNGNIFEPINNAISTHILKPQHSKPDLYWQTVRNEWFVMCLARKLGLTTPDVSVCYFPQPAYIVKRFDRDEQGRIHTLDACQLLGLSHTYKYRESSIERLNQVAQACRASALARITIFRWIIFNTLVGNTDAHLKNISVFYNHTGVTVTPMYDLVSTAIYSDGQPVDSVLSQKLNGKLYLADVTQDDLIVTAKSLGIHKTVAQREITNQLNKIESEAIALYKQVEVDSTIPASYKAGELKMLREIIYLVIKEMVSKLS